MFLVVPLLWRGRVLEGSFRNNLQKLPVRFRFGQFLVKAVDSGFQCRIQRRLVLVWKPCFSEIFDGEQKDQEGYTDIGHEKGRIDIFRIVHELCQDRSADPYYASQGNIT